MIDSGVVVKFKHETVHLLPNSDGIVRDVLLTAVTRQEEELRRIVNQLPDGQVRQPYPDHGVKA